VAGKRISRRVLTGGPCSGKTLGLAMLSKRLPGFGVKPFFVPELATLVGGSGFTLDNTGFDKRYNYEFQKNMLMAQLALEDHWMRFAELDPAPNKVLICDRGGMDNEGYIEVELFRQILRELFLNPLDLLDKRYDSVHHMATAADGAEEFYNLDNPARYEKTLEEARERDRRTLAAWVGHEHLRIIGNYEIVAGAKRQIGFDAKLDWLLKDVCLGLGIPAPYEIERRFLVALDTDLALLPETATEVNIIQIYLLSRGDVQRRIRERLYGGSALYVYTEKKRVKAGVREEEERIIDACEYRALLRERDPKRRDVVKWRHSFVWEQQYFQLDEVNAPMPIFLLEIELTEERQEILLPPFIKVIKEVTDDTRYGNGSIAAGTCPGYE